MSSGDDSNREEELAVVNLENVKRISETYQPKTGKGRHKKGSIPRSVVQEIWKDRLTPRFYSRMMSVMFPEESNEVSFLSFYTIYKNLAEPETEIMFRALTIYHIATIHEPPFNYEQANEYPNAPYKAIKDYVCDVITSYLHSIIHFNMKEALAWLDLRASNTLIDGNLVASYMLKDLETHRNEVSIGSLEIWLEKNEVYYTVSEQLYLFLFGVNSYVNVKPLIPLPVAPGRTRKTLLALPDVLLLNSKLPKRAQRWTLAFNLDTRSRNWETLKQAIYGKSQTIIVIQDANGDTFGMYGSQRWFPSEGFFGNDECFLFTLKPDVNIYEGSGRDNNFQLFTESGIGMGGTAEAPGLFLNLGQGKGSTSLTCSTFREYWPPAREFEFSIAQVEVWTVDYDSEIVMQQERDVEQLIHKTPYMRKKGNEKNRLEQPEERQKQEPANTILDVTVPVESVTKSARCCGECATYSHKSQPKNWSPSVQGGCCSKRCAKKRLNRHEYCAKPGKGDGDQNICSIKQYPQREQDVPTRQCRKTEVKVKTDNRRFRKSFDSRQMHGGAGFIHPSLAKEENERNAKAKADGAKSPTSPLSPTSPTSSPSPTSPTAPPSTATPNTVKKANPRTEPQARRKSNLPMEPTTPAIDFRTNQNQLNSKIDNQTQVGESRLMKPTCRLYKRMCGCVRRNLCECPQTDTNWLFMGTRQEYMVKACNEEINLARRLPTNNCAQPLSLSSNFVQPRSPTGNTVQQRTTGQLMQPSIPVIVIDMINCDPIIAESIKRPPPRTETKDEVQKTTTGERTTMLVSKQTIKSITEPTKRNDIIRKEEETVRKHNFKPITYSETKFALPLDASLPEWSNSENDCRCSSSTDSSDMVASKNTTAPICYCGDKVSAYLTRRNITNIINVPLDEISSSVCSCIFDNKNKLASTSEQTCCSKKETQILTKSAKESSGQRNLMNKMEIKTKSRRLSNRKCTSLEAPLKLTGSPQNYSSRSCVSAHSSFHYIQFEPLPVPPTCQVCRSQVTPHGCLCSTHQNPLQTEQLLQQLPPPPLYSSFKSGGSEGGSRRSVVIGRDITSGISISSKTEIEDDKSIGVKESSPKMSETSSLSSQHKPPQKQTCKTSCKCSLDKSYFPSFPEDHVKEGIEVCSCASYNGLKFPVFVETPQAPQSPEPSVISHTAENAEEIQTVNEEETNPEKKCGCEENDSTIIILNVAKCNTIETVEKIIQELEAQNGDPSHPNATSLVVRCKDFTPWGNPCTSKGGPEREALRQQIEKILQKKSLPKPPEQDQSK